MPASPRSAVFPTALAALALAGAATFADTARAGGAVNVVVLKEHGVGTAAAAQPYLDQLIAVAGKENGWDPASKGRYETTRAGADAFVKSDAPHFGIFSLAAYLDVRAKYNLEPVGSATMSTGGGQQYFLASKTQGSLGDCKGKKLATDHFDDTRFIEKVVAAGQFKAADFTLVTTRRFGEAGRKVVNGDADCALLDDAQLANLVKLDPAAKSVWQSGKLPPMVIAAFPAAPAAERTTFQASLPKICPQNQQVCTSVGLQTLTSASASTYDGILKLYNAP